MKPRHLRSEQQIEVACDRLVLDAGGTVLRFARVRGKRARGAPGVPARRYRVHGFAFWWQPKSSRGRLTSDQFQFLQAENETRQFVGAGDDDALRKVLSLLAAPDHSGAAREVAWRFTEIVIGRGIVTYQPRAN